MFTVRIYVSLYIYIQYRLQRTGSLDIIYDMYPKHQDPDYGAFIDQVKTYHKFYGNWPEHLAKDLEKAWQVHAAKLQRAKHAWQVAKGPVAAPQCYLMERGWSTDQHYVWTKPGYNGQDDFKMGMHSKWPALKQELKRAEAWDRLHQISRRSLLQEVQRPLETKRNATALMTWHQGAIFIKFSDGQQHSHPALWSSCNRSPCLVAVQGDQQTLPGLVRRRCI